MSAGRAPRVEAELGVDLSRYAAGMRDARQQADALIKSIEANRAEVAVNTDEARRDLAALAREVGAILDNDAAIDVTANTDAAAQELSRLQQVMAQVDNARATVSAIADTDTAMRELQTLQARLSLLDDRPVNVQARADVDSAIRDLNQLRAVMGQVEADTVQVETRVGGMGARLGETFGGLGRSVAGFAGGMLLANGVMGAVGAAMNLVTGAGIGLNAQLESTTIQFETMMGSADQAREHVAFLFEFAKCVDEETEALTTDGWKSFEDLCIGDLILTINTNTGMAEWQPVQDIHRYPGLHRVVRMENDRHSSLTTPQHRWPIRPRGLHRDRLLFATSETLVEGDKLIGAAPLADTPTEARYSDAFVDLAGWFWTEGSIYPGGHVTITQSERANPEKVESIHQVVASHYGDGTGWSRYATRTDGAVVFRIPKRLATDLLTVAPDKIPTLDFLRSLTAEQLNRFIAVSLAGDGHIRQRTGQMLLTQKRRDMAERFADALSLAGMRSRVMEVDGGRRWAVSIYRRTAEVCVNTIESTSDVYDGTVWCPQVENGTWYARRGGHRYFTGNSTPFETRPIIEASRFLQLFGKDALNTTENLTRIGNAAATAQAPIEELGFWVGRLYAAIQGGQPFGESAMRLQELGVLSAETRTEMERLQKAGASGAEIWALYTADLDKMTGAMEKQAGTWAGLTSTLSDIVQLTTANLLAPWFEQAKDAMEGLIGAAEGEQFTATMERWRARSADLAVEFRAWVSETGPQFLQMVQDAAPAVVNLAQAAVTLGTTLGNAIGPALKLYDVLSNIKDLGTFDFDIPGTDQTFSFDPVDAAAQAPGTAQTYADIAEGVDSVTSALERNSDVEAEAIVLSNQHADARQRFINEHAYDPEYSGLAGQAQLLDDANRAAAEAIGINYQMAESAAYVNRQREFAEAIANDLGLAESVLAERARDYLQAVLEQVNVTDEMVAAQRDAEMAAQAANTSRREGLDTTRVTTQAEGELEVALARVRAAYLALDAVQRNAAQAQGQINGVIDVFAQQGGEYQSELQSLEAAYAGLQSRQEQGIALSETEQQFLANYPAMQARVTGAVEDAAIQEGLAAAAKVEVWRAQEDLNAAIDRGETDLTGYNERLKTAQDYLSDVDPASGATQAIETLGTSIDKLVPLFQGLLDAMTDLDEQEVDPEVTMKKDLFDKGATEVEGDMITLGTTIAEPEARLNDEPFASSLTDANVGLTEFDGAEAVPLADLDTAPFDGKLRTASGALITFGDSNGTATVDADDAATAKIQGASGALTAFDGTTGRAYLTLDASQFYAALDTARGFLPFSPAKEGPFSREPNWGFLTDGMERQTRPGAESAAASLAGYFPMGRATTGALAAPLDWSFLFEGLDPAAETFAEQAADRIAGFLSGIDVNAGEDGLLDLDQAIAETTVLRDALAELGDVQGVAILNEQLAQMQAESARMHQIVGTDAVQAWLAAADATRTAKEEAEAATRAAEAYAETVQSLVDPNARERLRAQYREDQIALQTAILSGASPEEIAILQANYDASLAALQRYQAAFQIALDNGIFTQSELIALAAEGGDQLRAVIESGWLTTESAIAIAERSVEGLQAILAAGLISPDDAARLAAENNANLQIILESGILSPDQIEQLIATADEAGREILAAFLGEEYVAEIEDRLNDIDAATYEALKGMVKQGFLSGQDLVTAVADGLASGRLSVQQAMELIGADIESISDENAIALIDTYEQLGQDLARAYASGSEDAIEDAQAAWDQFIAYLATIAEASGMTVEEIIAQFDSLRSAASETQQALEGVSFAVGGSPGAEQDPEVAAENARLKAARGEILAAYREGEISLSQMNAELAELAVSAQSAAESLDQAAQSVERSFGDGINNRAMDALIDANDRRLTGPGGRNVQQFRLLTDPSVLEGFLSDTNPAVRKWAEGLQDQIESGALSLRETGGLNQLSAMFAPLFPRFDKLLAFLDPNSAANAAATRVEFTQEQLDHFADMLERGSARGTAQGAERGTWRGMDRLTSFPIPAGG